MIEQVAMARGRVAVVGHRGAAAYAPENTLASFEMAAAQGAHAFECDVRLTLDGEVVVVHDALVDRVSDGTGLVAEMTLAQLRELDFAAHLPEFGCQRVPTLADALRAAKRLGLDIVVELKGEPRPTRDLVTRAVAVVHEEGMAPRCAIQSFDGRCLLWVREADVGLPVGLLYCKELADAVGVARDLGAASLRPHSSLVTPRLVDEAHAAGMCVYAWRANDADTVAAMAVAGVDSVGTDCPGVASRVLAEMGRLA